MADFYVECPFGSCGDIPFSDRTWKLLLDLGVRHGWRPAGTLPPDPEHFWDWMGDPEKWNGCYFPPEGQEMTTDDARGLADALERALADLPHHDALSGKVIPDTSARDGLALWNRPVLPDVTVSPFEEFSGPNKGVSARRHRTFSRVYVLSLLRMPLDHRVLLDRLVASPVGYERVDARTARSGPLGAEGPLRVATRPDEDARPVGDPQASVGELARGAVGDGRARANSDAIVMSHRGIFLEELRLTDIPTWCGAAAAQRE